jgi:hypothetical protein
MPTGVFHTAGNKKKRKSGESNAKQNRKQQAPTQTKKPPTDESNADDASVADDLESNDGATETNDSGSAVDEEDEELDDKNVRLKFAVTMLDVVRVMRKSDASGSWRAG